MTSISAERAALANIRPLRRREQWGSQYDYTGARAVTEPARYVFVHITITNPGNYSSDDAHARAVEAIGISRFPSTGVSYNRLHFQSGQAMEGQPIGRRGAHTVNDLTRSSCVTSGCPSRGAGFDGQANLNYTARAYVICQNVGHTVTDAELHALAKSIAADKIAGFVRRDAPIHGHRCVSSKSCPADQMWARMAELEQLVDHYLSTLQEDDVALTPAQEAAIAKAGWLADQWAQGAQFEMDLNVIRSDLQLVLANQAALHDVAVSIKVVADEIKTKVTADATLAGARWEQSVNEGRSQEQRLQAKLDVAIGKLDELIAGHEPPPEVLLPKA